MTDEKNDGSQRLADRVTAALLRLPWADVLSGIRKALRAVLQGRSHRSLYEVLDDKSTLERRDRQGKKATFNSRERVRCPQVG